MSDRFTQLAIEDGIERADENADQEWKDCADRALRLTARRLDRFTADEVWDTLRDRFPLAATHNPSAMGPVFRRAATDGVIRNTGMWQERSKFAQRHRSLTIWESIR